MAGQVKELKKGEILFREGDPSDCLYVIKKGQISVTKAKGSGEIELAVLKAGEMIGEMAFFDNKPRSAGGVAKVDATVIVLPFSALYAQFQNFPEWLKAMVKTVNAKLRDANAKIKNLEAANNEENILFTPYMITRICGIISLVTYKSGEKVDEGFVVPYWTLRTYCIQIFQAPTNKLDKMLDALQGFGITKVEDLGEGKKKITILKHKLLDGFVDWYNDYLFKDESKRITVSEKEFPILKALVFYGKQQTPNDKGIVKVSLTDIQNNSMKDLSYLVNAHDSDSLAEKGLVQEKQSGEEGILTQEFVLADLEKILPYWEIVHALGKMKP